MTEKYKNLRKQIDSDQLLFESENFRIEPNSGVIWPGSQTEIKVYFHPTKDSEMFGTAFCELDGREMRLPFQIKGQGIGPKARFSYDLLDLEELFINTTHKYHVVLENRGDIDVNFNLLPSDSLFGPLFEFEPNQGNLKVGQEARIDIKFSPNILGDIYEEFQFNLLGSNNPLTLIIKGKVIGPNISLNVHEINFSKVSYGFPAKTSVSLINESKLGIVCQAYVTADSQKDISEFKIKPSVIYLGELETKEIDIEFNPAQVKPYNLKFMIDVDRVSKEVVQIPIKAVSIAPEVIQVYII